MVLGIGISTFHPQSIALISIFFKHRKGLAAGAHGIGGSIGVAAAPLAGGLLIAAYGWREGLLILFFPAEVVAVLLLFSLKEPPRSSIGKGMFKGISKPIILLRIVSSLLGAVQSGFIAFLPSYFVSLGHNIAFAGIATSVLLVPGIFSQLIGGGLYDRFGGKWVFVLSLRTITVLLLLFNLVEGVMAFPVLALI